MIIFQSGRGHNTVLLVSEDGKTFTNKKLIND